MVTEIHGDDERRFWSKVEKTESCWLWHGKKSRDRYPQFAYGPADEREHVYSHRKAYEDLVGPIPEGLDLDHLCRVRNCVNPEHLEPVTRSENILRGFAARRAS